MVRFLLVMTMMQEQQKTRALMSSKWRLMIPWCSAIQEIIYLLHSKIFDEKLLAMLLQQARYPKAYI